MKKNEAMQNEVAGGKSAADVRKRRAKTKLDRVSKKDGLRAALQTVKAGVKRKRAAQPKVNELKRKARAEEKKYGKEYIRMIDDNLMGPESPSMGIPSDNYRAKAAEKNMKKRAKKDANRAVRQFRGQ